MASSKDSPGSIKPASAEKNRPGNFLFGEHGFTVRSSSEKQSTHIFAKENFLTGLVNGYRNDNWVYPWMRKIMQSSPMKGGGGQRSAIAQDAQQR
jgi:hypothetical protein